MLDKAKLGARYTCFQCSTKFYDLQRPEAICPECQANQVDAPQRDVKALLGRSKTRPRGEGEEEVGFEEEEEEAAADDDDDDVEGADDDEEEAEGGEEEEW